MPGIKPLHVALRISTLRIGNGNEKWKWLEMSLKCFLTCFCQITNIEKSPRATLHRYPHGYHTLPVSLPSLWPFLSTSTAGSSSYQNISWYCSRFVPDLLPFSSTAFLWGISSVPFNYHLSADCSQIPISTIEPPRAPELQTAAFSCLLNISLWLSLRLKNELLGLPWWHSD